MPVEGRLASCRYCVCWYPCLSLFLLTQHWLFHLKMVVKALNCIGPAPWCFQGRRWQRTAVSRLGWAVVVFALVVSTARGQSSDLSACQPLFAGCEAGDFVYVTGGTCSCLPCEAGTASTAANLTVCESCPLDTFAAAGASACAACPDLSVTEATGQISADACVCSVGSFRNGDGDCVECGEGGDCAGGSAPPVAQPGFLMSRVRV